MGVGDQGPVVRQAGPIEGLAVPGEALTAGVELDRQVADEADAPVAVGDEVGDTVVGAGAVGADDAVGGQARSGTVDEHDGEPRGAVGLEVGVVGADGRHDQQDADAAGEELVRQGAFLVRVVRRGAHEQGQSAVADRVLDTAGHRSEERVAEVGDDQTDGGVGPADTDVARHEVRLEAELGHGGQHLFPGLGRRGSVLVENAGDRLGADAHFAGDVGQGRAAVRCHGGNRLLCSSVPAAASAGCRRVSSAVVRWPGRPRPSRPRNPLRQYRRPRPR